VHDLPFLRGAGHGNIRGGDTAKPFGLIRRWYCRSCKRKPSEYVREMCYSLQPMEIPDDLSIVEATFK